MKKLLNLLLLVGLLIGCFLGIKALLPTDEKRIQTLFFNLSGDLSFSRDFGNIQRGLRIESLPGYFTSDCVIQLDVRGVGSRSFRGRNDIASTARNLFGWPGDLEVRFLDIVFREPPDGDQAEVELTATINTGEAEGFSAQEMRFQLRKVDKKWLIEKARTFETLVR